jgi:hypothetical protein
MADETQLLYLEPDDEITTVVRRLREADAPRVILVASGRTKATTSAVALRLLAQVAAEEGRDIALVADPAARALAADAGIAAFGSVAEATEEGASPAPAQPPASAPIHVVRGEPAPATVDEPLATLPRASAPPSVRGMEETTAVQLPPPAPRVARPERPSPRRERRPTSPAVGFPLAVLIGLLALLVAGGAAAATVLPAADISILRQAVEVGPLSYTVTPDVHPSDASELTSTMSGDATGQRTRRTSATGVVRLYNYSDENVPVPAGTLVSANGEIFFQTTAEIVVPDSFFSFAGTADVDVEATEAGPQGNVDALAIDRIEDRDVDRALRGQGPDNRRIENLDPTTGGEERELLVVTRRDVERVTDAIRANLQRQLDEATAGIDDRIVVGDAPRPRISVPDDLVGHVTDEDQFSFELTGTLVDERPYVLTADAQAAAESMALADAPEGATIDDASIQVELGEATLDGEVISVPATVTALALPDVDEVALRAQLAGKTVAEAEAALASIGTPAVTLWPFWVDRVPQLEWRISIDVQSADSDG